MGKLTLICGSPNAGKTTYSSRYENAYHYDDMRKQGLKIADIINQDDVVIEGLFETANARRRIANMADGYKTLIWLNTPLDECVRRENRGRPIAMVTRHFNMFEPPTYDEGWDEIILIRPNEVRKITK
jgi:tRNA uridine 5-carbamoylmethylation protein Kti12